MILKSPFRGLLALNLKTLKASFIINNQKAKSKRQSLKKRLKISF
ncbi:hypothetical protein HPHPH27_0061 [Helicobacter pylori Hp H-27]|uniref:Uncharacterized protein n=1 Tax=Helicobacter pylori Hp A-9 TaxID=992034 RepID=I9ZWC9_HELPX|nr:hypothetical protein HPHPA9_1662 [Helicobacter pylori Hp A-9]EJB53448.1 hypothetical protein HPHPH27_0061 [Helicobacter pylori Hp H-27]